MDRINGIEAFRNALAHHLPSAMMEVDAPEVPGGIWWFDVTWNDVSATIEWRPKAGYGVSFGPESGYGEGAEYIFDDADSAARAVAQSLRNRGQVGRVLVVTADEESQKHILNALRHRGFDIAVAASSIEGTRLLGAVVFDILIIDLPEPAVPPNQTVLRLRSATSTHPPVVFVLSDAFGDLPTDFVHVVMRKPAIAREVAALAHSCLRAREPKTPYEGEATGDVSAARWTPPS